MVRAAWSRSLDDVRHGLGAGEPLGSRRDVEADADGATHNYRIVLRSNLCADAAASFQRRRADLPHRAPSATAMTAASIEIDARRSIG